MSTDPFDTNPIRAWIAHQQYGRGVPLMCESVAGLFEQIAALTVENQIELWTRLTVPYCTRGVDTQRLLARLAGENPSVLSRLRTAIQCSFGTEEESDNEDV